MDNDFFPPCTNLFVHKLATLTQAQCLTDEKNKTMEDTKLQQNKMASDNKTLTVTLQTHNSSLNDYILSHIFWRAQTQDKEETFNYKMNYTGFTYTLNVRKTPQNVTLNQNQRSTQMLHIY